MQPRDLAANEPYVPGSGIEEVARELGVDPGELVTLSSNENPHGPSPSAIDAIHEYAGRINQYPKAAHTDLTERIAAEWALAENQIWLSPGADGALDYLARAFLDPGDSVLVPEPGFAYYAMSARYNHANIRTYTLSATDNFTQRADDVRESYDDERIVYLTTPHNPTGTEFPRTEVETLLESVGDDTLVVVDEAYQEFSESPSRIDRLDRYDNLAVTRTFSKAYGLAGLRVGYAAVPESWGDAYARVNTPFAVNELACRAGLAALDDDGFLERTIDTARWGRQYMHDELAVETVESAGNFVLARVGDATAVSERSKREGVIIRDCTSFGLPEHVRISCGTREATKTAVATVNEIVAERDRQEVKPDD